MSFTGMSIPEVRSLANRMRTDADRIEEMMASLTAALESTQWVGPDRERFIGEWRGNHCTSLSRVCDGLRQAATLADQNAAQQEQASNC